MTSHNTKQDNIQESHIFYARKYTVFSICIGILFFFVGIFYIVPHISGIVIIPATALIIANIVRYNMEYVAISKDSISIKLAPVRARVNIPFSEITSVSNGPKKVIIYYDRHRKQNTQKKKVVIPLGALMESDKTRLLATIDQYLGEKIKSLLYQSESL